MNQRWLGGLLTNFSTVSKRLARMKELEELDFEDSSKSGFTKKELLIKKRELDKLHKSLGGIRNLTKTPSAVWVVDTKKEHLAIDEAHKLGIPVIAILDSNCDPDEVQYPIPGNDDAIRSVGLLTRIIADAAAEGLIQRHQKPEGSEEVEPLAEWEAELLQASENPQSEAEKIEEVDGRVTSTKSNTEAVAEVIAAEVPSRRTTRMPRSPSTRPPPTRRSCPSTTSSPTPSPRPRSRRRPLRPRRLRPRRLPPSRPRRRRREDRGREGSAPRRPGREEARWPPRRPTTSLKPATKRIKRMADFSLADIKTLRERLGTGMVDTKNALVEAGGDLEKATELLRLKGAKGNAKRADRSTSEGLVAAVESGDRTRP